MKKGRIHIGTSGWSYKHWKESFYPPGHPVKEQFSFYSGKFDSVEINNSFYKLPSKGTFTMWRKSAPEGFVYAVKASRFFTHMKKLILDRQMIRPIFDHVAGLRDKLGPILFQLPPGWKFNPGRLAAVLSILPKSRRYAMECREHSWYNEQTYAILRQHNVAFCIYELEHHLSPMQVTADFVYIRLHGPGDKYQGSYTDKALQEWSDRIKKWSRAGKVVFIYFDNDQPGFAAHNAVSLQWLIHSK